MGRPCFYVSCYIFVLREQKDLTYHKDSGFDRVAWFYDWLAGGVFGKSIKKAQTRFLDHLTPGSRVLIIGGGTGWILDELPDQNLFVFYLEASPLMIAKARARKPVAASNTVVFQLGNEEVLSKENPFDFVFTPFFLDVFEKRRFSHLFFILDDALKPGGKWLWTDFVFPENQPFNQLLLNGMYVFFRIVCGIKARNLPPVGPFFRSSGYQQMAQDFFFKNFISSKVFLKKSE